MDKITFRFATQSPRVVVRRGRVKGRFCQKRLACRHRNVFILAYHQSSEYYPRYLTRTPPSMPKGGHYSNALQAGSHQCRKKVVELLLNKGAVLFGNALRWLQL